MEARRLTAEEIATALARVPDWSVEDGKLHREFAFPDFVTAFGFMSRAALWFEKLDHHAEWQNVYGRVVIDLVTHDVGGLSTNDFELAVKLDELASR